MRKRIAIYLSGRSKLYDKWFILQLDSIYSLYDVDIFASFNEEYNETFIKIIKPKLVNFEKYNYPYYLDLDKINRKIKDTKIYNMCSMFYNNMIAFKLIEKYMNLHNIKYDFYIKFRPDIINYKFPDLIDPVEINTIYTPDTYHYGYNYQINDRIAYGDYWSMKIYSELYYYIDTYTNHDVYIHPETLLSYHLKYFKINNKLIKYDTTLDNDRF